MNVVSLLERCLIEHCSPTLASLKTANLFNLVFTSEEELEEQFQLWRVRLNEKGISMIILRRRKLTALIYVFRKAHLQADLKKPGVARFLSKYGYLQTDWTYAIDKLTSRFELYDDFPHEIGIFLGYPLGDVIGFIRNKGKKSKCSGCWKVYCDEWEARKTFTKFKKCKDVYTRLWNQGRTVWQLTVAA